MSLHQTPNGVNCVLMLDQRHSLKELNQVRLHHVAVAN